MQRYNLAMEAVALELDEPRMCSWAEALGAQLRGGDVVLLRGEMGAGKTTLVRALARGLRVARPERVCSPTYTICMIHPGPIELVHVDLFRLGEDGPIGDAAFESLGLEHDELPGPERVLVVEWSQLWREPPAEHLELSLARLPSRPEVRRLEARPRGPRWVQEASVGSGSGVLRQGGA
jgi:tRNA threonylcarbamoyladenosine biosynthesis protein TsaE